MPKLEKKDKSFWIVALFALLLASVVPDHAGAQVSILPGVPITNVTGDLNQVSSLVSGLGHAFLTAFEANLQAALGIKNTQAIVDATDKATLTAAELALEQKHNMPTDANGNPDSNECSSNEGAAAQEGMNHGTEGLGDALGGGAQQTSGLTPSQKVKLACASGNIDTANEYPDLAKVVTNCQGDTNTSNINNRLDADINFASIDDDDMMEMPNGITFPNGVMMMPTTNINSLPPHQKSFVDAYNVCLNILPLDPPNVAATGTQTPTTQILKIQAQRAEKLKHSGAFHACTAEVARNTATSSEDSGWYGGNIAALYASELAECTSMSTVGIIDLPDDPDKALANCAAYGLSPARAEKLESARFDSEAYDQNLMTKGNLTLEDITMLKEQHKDSWATLTLLHQISFEMAVNATNTMPDNGMPGPVGRDQAVPAQ